MSARDKGNQFERDVAAVFNETFYPLTFRRTPLSGGWDKTFIQGDISCDNKKFNLVAECKNHKTLHVPQWWKQVDGDTPKHKIPLLIMKISARYHSLKNKKLKNETCGMYTILRMADAIKLAKVKTDLVPNMVKSRTYEGSSISITSIIFDLQNSGDKVADIHTSLYSGKLEHFILLKLDYLMLNINEEKCYTNIRKTRRVRLVRRKQKLL